MILKKNKKRVCLAHGASGLACFQLASTATGLVWVDELLGIYLLAHVGHLLWHTAAALLRPLMLRAVPHAITKVDDEP